jgi:G:T/U-mismatch repair DNA glycosylase
MNEFNSSNIENHPFKLLFAEGEPKFLVVGTFPTTLENMAFNFFYPNNRNRFWSILKEVFPSSKTCLNLDVSKKNSPKEKIQNELDRKNFCIENQIALTDMLASCYRMDNNSGDEQLLVCRYCSILQVLKNHLSIERIILTGKSKATSAHHHFYQYLSMENFPFQYCGNETIGKGQIKFENREIEIYSLPSTSSRSNKIKKEDLVKIYKDAFDL